MQFAKVWPLIDGIQGVNAHGSPVLLTPGVPGWLPLQEAQDRERAGEVQMMVGLRPQDLKPARTGSDVFSAAPSAAAASYIDREAGAEPGEEPEVEEPAPVKRRPGRPRKKRTYQRRDMVADREQG